jgi:Zn-dependent M28 family amino/carboxypeptidase
VNYVEAKCRSWGLKTERQAVPGRDENFFAYVPGSTDEVVVVGAHLDHLGNGNLGADDNGSGSTCLLSIARAFSQLEPGPRTIVFQWYTAEESGLLGSQYYVGHPTFPKGSPSIRKHVAMVNLDMVGRFRLDYQHDAAIVAEAIELTADFKGYIAQLKGKYPFGDSLTQSSGNRSDHARFASAGVQAVWLFTGTHPDYHTRFDTPDKINYDGLRRISQYATELAWLCVHEGHTANQPAFVIDEMDLVNVGGEPFHQEPSTQK